MLLACLALLPLSAGADDPHFYIVLSQNEDSLNTALFIKEYLSTFGIEGEIRSSIGSVTRDEIFSEGHPLSLRFWYMDDKLVLRSEDMRNGSVYFMTSEYGRKPNETDNRAWLVESLNDLAYDLYLDGLTDKDSRMKKEREDAPEEYPVIFIERGFGDSAGWEGTVLDALIAEGLDARLTENSMDEELLCDEHPFSLRFWVFPGFMELSLFDVSGECSEDPSYYIDMDRTFDMDEAESCIREAARQIKRLMENDRHLVLMRP